MASDRADQHFPGVEIWPTAQQGAKLGCLASLAGAVLLIGWIFMFSVWDAVQMGGLYAEGSLLIGALIEGASLASAWLLATGPLSLVAGTANAVVLWLWSRSMKRILPISLLIGVLIGVLSGLVLMEMVLKFNAFGPGRGLLSMNQHDLVTLAIVVGVTGSVGAWHGWRMLRYLSRGEARKV